ncbi:zinc finger protein 358-like isoform X35 [Haliotis rufescens]|uniref:zinc finger protein 358-like isoform X35 n=1 Tax=Haliotis rufescens TaxID=6454 RepID=UPI00201FA123|nr:zinc finger protein 358-like isoform X35 [Haliotis rufescens]
MFIETLEFTIPIDLCDLFSTLKKGPRSNLEFPASVNSYGTTQDASIQVALRSNKLTFKVDGVSSDASMISKSECKTLKLSIFDVDRTLMPQESYYSEAPSHSVSMSFPAKRSRDFSASVKSPPAKSSRTSYSDTSRGNTPVQFQNQNNSRTSEQLHSRTPSDSRVNVKLEPEDPDLIEIEPDPEPDDIVPKKETPYMQIDYSSDVPHTQTSQAALDRLSHPQSSHSQSPGSSSSSFHQNVPHVPDYAEPSTSQVHHGDQSADDFLVFQEQDDNDCDNDNDADFDNEDELVQDCHGIIPNFHTFDRSFALPQASSGRSPYRVYPEPVNGNYHCPVCDKVFASHGARWNHVGAVHDRQVYACVCGKKYNFGTSLSRHKKSCSWCITMPL